jgi:hypothetical protein
MHVNTTLFTLLHCYKLQPSNAQPQGVLVHFVSKVNKMCPRANIRLKDGVLFFMWQL